MSDPNDNTDELVKIAQESLAGFDGMTQEGWNQMGTRYLSTGPPIPADVRSGIEATMAEPTPSK